MRNVKLECNRTFDPQEPGVFIAEPPSPEALCPPSSVIECGCAGIGEIEALQLSTKAAPGSPGQTQRSGASAGMGGRHSRQRAVDALAPGGNLRWAPMCPPQGKRENKGQWEVGL